MYTQFGELMQYYHLDFAIYYLTVAAMLLNSLKIALYGRGMDKRALCFDLAVGAVLLAGVVCGLVFQGALLDIAQSPGDGWLGKAVLVFAADAAMLLFQACLAWRAAHK